MIGVDFPKNIKKTIPGDVNSLVLSIEEHTDSVVDAGGGCEQDGIWGRVGGD